MTKSEIKIRGEIDRRGYASFSYHTHGARIMNRLRKMIEEDILEVIEIDNEWFWKGNRRVKISHVVVRIK